MRRALVALAAVIAALGAGALAVIVRAQLDPALRRTSPRIASSLPWTLAALGGAALIAAGVLHFARRGLDPSSERLVARDATGAGALVGAGLVLFFLGLYEA